MVALALINVVAIFAAVGVSLVGSVLHVTGDLKTALEAVAGAVYVLWCAV
jgi:hypothetical protein